MGIKICTEGVASDAEAEKLAERVEEILSDYPQAKVIWLQTPLAGQYDANIGRVRLTAIVTWRDT